MSDRPAEIKPDATRAAETLRSLRTSIRHATAYHGRGLAGYALVSWGMDGHVQTAMMCNGGVIGDGLVATLAGNALNVHMASVVAHKVKLVE